LGNRCYPQALVPSEVSGVHCWGGPGRHSLGINGDTILVFLLTLRVIQELGWVGHLCFSASPVEMDFIRKQLGFCSELPGSGELVEGEAGLL
jgi:hypothetical protein